MSKELHPLSGNKKKNGSNAKALPFQILAVILAVCCLAFLFRLVYTVYKMDHMELNTDPSLVVRQGDTVSIEFSGTIDGEPFTGGSTNGKSEKLLIGSRSFIDDFEEQLIGHHPGETVSVEVTFPEDYPDMELRNQEAVYETKILGIYQ